MSKTTSTIAFVSGLLLVAMCIAGILAKGEELIKEKERIVVEIPRVKAKEHQDDGSIPVFLKVGMYVTLVISAGATVINVSKYGLSKKGRTSSLVAFVGGILLVSLGFLSTLAENESRIKNEENRLTATELVIKKEVKKIDKKLEEEHHSGVSAPLKYAMFSFLFIGGVFTIIHVSKFGLA